MKALLLATLAFAASAPAFTESQLKKLKEGIEKTGTEQVPGKSLCDALKIGSPADKEYKHRYHQRRLTTPDKIQHSFGYSNSLGDYLFVRETNTHIQYLHADSDFNLVAGASYQLRGSGPDPMKTDDAAEALRKELAVWKRWADAP